MESSPAKNHSTPAAGTLRDVKPDIGDVNDDYNNSFLPAFDLWGTISDQEDPGLAKKRKQGS